MTSVTGGRLLSGQDEPESEHRLECDAAQIKENEKVALDSYLDQNIVDEVRSQNFERDLSPQRTKGKFPTLDAVKSTTRFRNKKIARSYERHIVSAQR